MKRQLVLFAAAATLLVAGSATAGFKRIDYASYAGEPVKEISYYQLYNWQRTGKKSLVIWTKPSTAYLLSVAQSCTQLMDARLSIELGGFTATKGRLKANSDDVIIGDLHCRITAIQPLDMERMKADRKRG